MASKTEKRNALSELAKEMKEGLDCLVCVPHLVKIYGKAQRIIAELAKVDATYEADVVHNNICLLTCDAFKKCRAIAEE